MEILGIDIGGTGIKGNPVDTVTGEALADRHRLLTPKPATPDAMVDTVKELVDHFNWKGPIGCGFPAAIKHEIVMTASNIDKSWIGKNASEMIRQRTGCPTHLVNDVDAAGIAEMSFGEGKGVKGTVIVVAVGTGIGTAVFTDGYLLPNSELGHVSLGGIVGEEYASNATRKREELGWEEWGHRLNRYLKRLEFLLWPDLIILGGGVSKHSHEFLSYIDINCEVIPAKMLNHAGTIGAAIAAKLKMFG